MHSRCNQTDEDLADQLKEEEEQMIVEMVRLLVITRSRRSSIAV